MLPPRRQRCHRRYRALGHRLDGTDLNDRRRCPVGKISRQHAALPTKPAPKPSFVAAPASGGPRRNTAPTERAGGRALGGRCDGRFVNLMRVMVRSSTWASVYLARRSRSGGMAATNPESRRRPTRVSTVASGRCRLGSGRHSDAIAATSRSASCRSSCPRARSGRHRCLAAQPFAPERRDRSAAAWRLCHRATRAYRCSSATHRARRATTSRLIEGPCSGRTATACARALGPQSAAAGSTTWHPLEHGLCRTNGRTRTAWAAQRGPASNPQKQNGAQGAVCCIAPPG